MTTPWSARALAWFRTLASPRQPGNPLMATSQAQGETMTLVIGACGNTSGPILPGRMSDRARRIRVLGILIGIWVIAMPVLYAAGATWGALYLAVFVGYWSYGAQLSVNGAATAWPGLSARASAECWSTRIIITRQRSIQRPCWQPWPWSAKCSAGGPPRRSLCVN